MGKARVAPMKFASILSLELTATVLLAKCCKFIKKELQLECILETPWARVALGYVTALKGSNFLQLIKFIRYMKAAD